MQPIGDRAEGVVVEGGHFAGIDRSHPAAGCPNAPKWWWPHRHRIEPRRALALEQQAVGGSVVAGVAQGIADERSADKAGADTVAVGTNQRARRSAACWRCAGSGSSPNSIAKA